MYLKKRGPAGKAGKLRKLHNPDKLIRTVQFRILERILNLAEIPDYIYGFEIGKSIPKMAEIHTNKHVVISLDIKDFFPSIKQFMVKAMFEQLGIAEDAAGLLSELCTYKSYVPQGSLTAPKISNLIAAGTFGRDIKEMSDRLGLSLTIYADDITVSYNEPTLDRELNSSKVREVIEEITKLVRKYGFSINTDKTKIMRRHQRQWVCGAVVNEKVNMRRLERYALKALVHNSRTNGVEVEASKAKMEVDAFIRKYAGRINWMCQLNPDAGTLLKVKFRKACAPYLKKRPEIEIPELSWNSGIELPYVPEPEDEMIFNSGSNASVSKEIFKSLA